MWWPLTQHKEYALKDHYVLAIVASNKKRFGGYILSNLVQSFFPAIQYKNLLFNQSALQVTFKMSMLMMLTLSGLQL